MPQTNPCDPKPWQSVKRVDLEGAAHHNKITGESVPTPHVNSKSIPGGVRPALPGEIPSN